MWHHVLLWVHSFIAFISISGTKVLAAPALEITQYQWQDQLSETSNNWHRYVRSPKSNIIYPETVVSTTGNVTNANALITGNGPTILTRTAPSDEIPISNLDSWKSAPGLVIDFGQNVAGYLSIKFAGASNSTLGLPGIRLAFSETIQYGFLTNVSDFSRSNNADRGSPEKITPGSDQIAVKHEPYVWTNNHGCEYNGTQVCADGIHGFRYLRLYMDALPKDAPYTSSYGHVAIESISLNHTAYLGTPDTFTGWFESSDDDLNQWWYDGVYTNDLNTDTLDENSTDPRQAASPGILGKLVLLDGAKRDRDPYVGDVAVAGRTLYLSHDVHEAARNVLADLAEHQREDGWIPPASIRNYTLKLLDYPLWWVNSASDLLLYTGDVDFIEKYYHVITLTLDKFYPSITNPENQLIDKDLGFSDYGDYAFLGRNSIVTYFNVLYVLALDNAAAIAKHIGGHDADVKRWTARARNVSEAVNQYRWDSKSGAYWDGTCGFAPCDQHAQDGNSLSIISGVANRSQAEDALSYLTTHMSRFYGNAFYDNDNMGANYSQRVYAFVSYFEIEARFMTGKADSALDQIRRMYGWMSKNDPGITMWEGIEFNGRPYQDGFTSMAHGWSTGVVPALTNFVLGVIPTGPGFSTWKIKPIPGDVKWAKGVVPTPKGRIKVSWNNSQPGLFIIYVDAPPGTSGEISVPVNNLDSAVYLNTQPVWENSVSKGYHAQKDTEDGYVTVEVQGGEYTISVGSNEQS